MTNVHSPHSGHAGYLEYCAASAGPLMSLMAYKYDVIPAACSPRKSIKSRAMLIL
eukprot:CAMPEP_0174697464 /NCGR_PEP_ID=MMETSP1094-20130205/3325_1 /TAXON_ID=156173 /ORGANISM="Chrysochromulina brevifilum, Strain UTEX LB 985" /LENGTH=54 /DNA_ID=CAMNT_0015894453 /DNA_START=385 /DNA_END=549 /DNA_ORIENTATION=-